MRGSTKALAIVCAIAAASAACDIQVSKEGGVSVEIAEGRASDEFRRSYTLLPGGQLEIVNGIGDIQVLPSVDGEVSVTARRQVRAGSDDAARLFLQAVETIEEVSPNRVKLENRAPPEGSGARGSPLHLGQPDLQVQYRIGLPAGLNAAFRTDNGTIRLENVQGTLAARSTSGGIVGRGVSGALDASTVNGGIRVEFTAVTGDTELVSVNGGIRVELPRDIDATIDARTVNGGVIVDERFALDASERVRLRVAGRLNRGGPRINLQTTNGGIIVSPLGEQGRGGRTRPR